MAVFRVEKTRNYTVMSNHHLKNITLSLKAKGLLSVMLSLPDDWDYTLAGLAHISKEGVDAIREGIRELETAGYIVRNRVRNAKGQLTSTEYVIREQPVQPSPTLEEPVQEKPALENPILENPAQEKPVQEEPTLENPTQLNTYPLKPYLSKTYSSSTNPSNPHPSNPHPSKDDAPVQTSFQHRVDQMRQLVRNHLEYDLMCQQFDRNQLDEIVSLMVEVLCSKALFFTISGNEYPAELVHERLLSLRSSHVEYIFNSLSRTSTRVGNIKAYMLTVLFNAAATMHSYYDAQVRHDFPLLGGAS